MTVLAERYIGKEAQEDAGPPAIDEGALNAMKAKRERTFIESKAMPPWLAKIAFKDLIELIWVSKNPNMQLA